MSFSSRLESVACEDRVTFRIGASGVTNRLHASVIGYLRLGASTPL